ncbi:helix-turn-helix domain-containing protein [Tsukamurella soli]|uniref:helix-turn-helix domain-containing protein n=2 Tax=Tsukamurella soli TaxID=644556 RepID=UPI003619A8AD
MSWTRWKGLLALAVVASMAGNITHAVLTAPNVYGWGAAVAASLAPVFLFWATHNKVTAPGGARGWRADWVGHLVIASVALGAFSVSFMTLRALMLLFGFPPAVAAILPLVVDVTIAGASWELMQEAEASAAAPEHTDVVTQTPVAPADPRTIPVMQTPTPDPVPHHAPLAEPTPSTAVTQTVMQPHHAASAPVTSVDPAVAPVPAVQAVGDGGVRDAGDAGGDAGGGAGASPRDALVLHLASAGASSRQIAEQVGVSPSTVQRIVRAQTAG